VTSGIVRRLTGYDVSTERLAFQRDIPDASWAEVKALARLSVRAERMLASVALTDDQARAIARLLGTGLPSERMAFFLEPFAVS
jgi:hypothetical protein